MTDPQRGILAMAVASTVWGMSPIYYKLLIEVPPLEVLSHRTLWSLLFFGVVLAAQGRLRQVRHLLAGRRMALVALAAVMISTNWFVFILSVQIGRAVQASLGYYIFPLVAVLLGVVAVGERLSVLKGTAVGLAAGAVALLTYGLGVAPWVSLLLAATFGAYGLIKKRLDAGPVVSVTAEVLCLAPLAAGWLLAVHSGWVHEDPARAGAVFGHDLRASLLLALSGVLTGGPLILMSYASRRISMAALGLTQYLNPTLQFLCATLLFREPFTGWHLGAFSLIWAALLLYSVAAFRQDRALRRAARSAGTSAASVI